MVLPLGDAETRLGSESARLLAVELGDTITVQDAEFTVVEILSPKASLDDCRIYINLAKCQELLGKSGQINYILAFLCLHQGSLERAIEMQQEKLAEAFPGFRLISRMDIAQGRHLARLTTQQTLRYLLLIVAAATVVVIAVTGLQEVHERRFETGIMVSMGVSQVYIVSLYLVKAMIIAACAAILGFLLGSLLAVQLTTPFLVVNTQPVTFLWRELPAALAITLSVVMLAETVPVTRLLTLDPASILTEQ
jgi:ABC-type lipoprotein release transport system permease subunit